MRATLEGTAAELREFFGRELPEGTGTELLIPTLVEELQGVTGTARKALRFICEHAPEVGFDAVASYMGVDTRVLSGYMSSIGRRAPSLSTRFKRDYDKRVYRVPPESAGTILKAPVNIGASQSSGPLLVSLQGDHRSADKGDMGDKDTALLTLVCPHCGEAFPSMMQIDRATFATIRLKSVLEHCSACGKAARFEKGDYFFVAGERHS